VENGYLNRADNPGCLINPRSNRESLRLARNIFMMDD